MSEIDNMDRINPTLTLRSWPPAAFEDDISVEVQVSRDQALDAIRNGVEVIVTINEDQVG